MAAEKRERHKPAETSCRVELAHGRWRHLGWALFGAASGVFLITKMGSVAHWVGLGLLALAAYNLSRFVLTILKPPGRIVVDDEKVVLPRGVCRGSLTFELGKLEHAFFLRRSVPWTRAGPILIVEAGGQIFSYPRDWFSSDADQRRVAEVLGRRLERRAR